MNSYEIMVTPWDFLACENLRFSSLFAAGDVSRNVPSGEERGETDVFAGYGISATESKVRTILQDSISHSGYKTEILIKRLKSQKLGER